MSGALIKWELKKLWSLPMVPIFLALCLGLDLFAAGITWYEQRDAAEAAAYIADVTGQVGRRMGPELDAALAALPERPLRDALAASVAGKKDVYEGYDAAWTGEDLIRSFGVTGPAADLIRAKFEKFQASVDALAAMVERLME